VALLYQPSGFKVLNSKPITVVNPEFPESKTRDILYASGKMPTGDTLHVFVCHFPSRLGGELESEQKRMFVASVLRSSVDNVFRLNPNAAVVIMGDSMIIPIIKVCSSVGAFPPDQRGGR
jgi:endonuclease/exonuclease/phosphatase family metal-dependent hydrolase